MRLSIVFLAVAFFLHVGNAQATLCKDFVDQEIVKKIQGKHKVNYYPKDDSKIKGNKTDTFGVVTEFDNFDNHYDPKTKVDRCNSECNKGFKTTVSGILSRKDLYDKKPGLVCEGNNYEDEKRLTFVSVRGVSDTPGRSCACQVIVKISQMTGRGIGSLLNEANQTQAQEMREDDAIDDGGRRVIEKKDTIQVDGVKRPEGSDA